MHGTRRDAVVIGAGQAGLSTAYGLLRQGFEPHTGFVVLDADDAPGVDAALLEEGAIKADRDLQQAVLGEIGQIA